MVLLNPIVGLSAPHLKQGILPHVAFSCFPCAPCIYHLHPNVPPMCRQVEIEVETCDKGGTFLGTIVLPGAKPINLGITLARMGLAKTQQFFAADR